MIWNYRVMKKKNEEGAYDYGIYEVYYDEKGKVIGHTENAMTPVVPSEEGLKYELEIMLKALNKETLTYKEN